MVAQWFEDGARWEVEVGFAACGRPVVMVGSVGVNKINSRLALSLSLLDASRLIQEADEGAASTVVGRPPETFDD